MSEDKTPEAISSTKGKTFVDITQDHSKLVLTINAVLKGKYSLLLSDGKLPSESIDALAEILSRVEDPIRSRILDDPKLINSPERMYAQAVANATIVFPYFSLEKASKSIKSFYPSSQSWGYMANGEIHLPKPESTITDSNSWYLIREILRSFYGSKLSENETPDSTVPNLSNEEVVKQRAVEFTIMRILQLVRNPASATIRKGDVRDVETHVKNAVDFVVLDAIFQRRTELHNLSISGFAAAEGRRTQKQILTTGVKKTLTSGNILVGYKLSEYLSVYQTTTITKGLESEPFISLILQFLRDISLGVPDEWQFPKNFFEAPSAILRSSVRQGPQIKTKKGIRANLYIPFSFVKSAECDPMLESTRRDMTDIGASVLQRLDDVNKLPTGEASKQMPFYREYLASAYIISDTCRIEWRRNAMIANTGLIRKAMIDDFPSLLTETSEKEYLELLRRVGRNLTFSPVTNNEDELKQIRLKLASLIKSKRDRRV
jgi:hypothetical protein